MRFFYHKFLIASTLALSCLPLQARPQIRDVECLSRGDRIILRFSGPGRTYRGRQKIKLKRLLFRNCDEHSVLNHHKVLKGVKLLAKSRFGFARVKLRVGSDFSPSKRIRKIRRGGGRRFHKTFLRNPKSDDFGPWQLWLRGLVKVKKIVLFLEEEGHDGWGWGFSEGRSPFDFKPLS